MIDNPQGVLGELQREVAAEVVAHEGRARRHLVVYLSGSHSYGFPSPDSDLDIKAVHTEATDRLLGLSPPPQTASRLEVVRGVEIDYTSNEIGAVLAGELEAARQATRLPARADVERVDALLRRVRGEAARRWIEREPGPFGREAPPAPEARWEEER